MIDSALVSGKKNWVPVYQITDLRN